MRRRVPSPVHVETEASPKTPAPQRMIVVMVNGKSCIVLHTASLSFSQGATP